MTSSAPSTIEGYLVGLLPERREVITAVRALVNARLPDGYVEAFNWGMISWEIPLSRYPATHNRQPLALLALAAQKNHYALYLMAISTDAEQALRDAYTRAGRKLDLGKSCLRFKRLDDLLQDEVGRVIASTPVETCIAQYEASRARS